MKKKRSGRSRSRKNKKKIDGRQQQKKSPSPKKTSRCWEGYEPTPGKIPYSKGSCRKI